MSVDLHAHSRVSDGSYPPEDLVTEAFRVGLSAMALTDHDTTEGLDRAVAKGVELGIEVIRGIELSCGSGLHMLVLFLPEGPSALGNHLEEIKVGRINRNVQMIGRLNALGLDITIEEVEKEAGEGVVGRPHFASVMVEKGYVSDANSAFNEYLGNSAPGYVDRETLTGPEAATLARQSGAVPIMAHPHTLRLDNASQFEGRLSELKSAGLVGMEVIYPSYDEADRKVYRQVARDYGFLPSGGSDFHGAYKPHIGLGTGIGGNVTVPESILEELRSFAS
jgi:predicted metal-dependent phosphoesterase TrpH